MIAAEDLAFEEFKPLVDLLVNDPESEIFMQYTGLKDKNGKDIYEGDIVKEWIKRYDLEKPEGEDTYYEFRTSQIIYSGHGFWVKDESFGWEGEDLWDWDNLEVIGNIYQNPELIQCQQSTPA